MENIKFNLDKYLGLIKDTQNFVNSVNNICDNLKIREDQIIKDREQIIKDRAELIKRSNMINAQVDSMREDRDNANQKANEAEKLRELAKGELIKASNVIEQMKIKEAELDKRAVKYKDLEDKEKNLKYLIELKESYAVKDNFIRKEQELLYDKQKSLEIREEKIQQQEERLKRLHNG
jgi:hypothetical protein